MTGTNAQRAAIGERPTCWNRPDYPDHVVVNWRTAEVEALEVIQQCTLVQNPMSKHCASWAVRAPDPGRPGDTGEDPATESIPGQEGWLCWGCRHLPDDPRVQARAAASALW